MAEMAKIHGSGGNTELRGELHLCSRIMLRQGKGFEMKRTRWILVLPACLAVSLFCVAYPIYVIRPFRAQGVRELMAALSVLRYRNAVTILSALVAIGAALAYWRRTTRTPSRMAAVSGALAVCVLA